MSRSGLSVGLGSMMAIVACTKVANPFYVDELGDEASSTGSESESSESESAESSESESSESESSESDSTDESESSESSSEDTDCPPSESGCPCLQGTQCFPGLTCIDGICLLPEDCTPENGAVHVDYLTNGVPANTTCTAHPSMQNTALVLTIDSCADGMTTATIVLDPLPPELAAIAELVDPSVNVLIHFEPYAAFIRLALPNYNLWLVEGPLLASADNPTVSDYPWEVAAVVGLCPSEPKFCNDQIGEFHRQGVRVMGQPFFGGSSGLIDPTLHTWVAFAFVDCMVPYYRFAILDGL